MIDHNPYYNPEMFLLEHDLQKELVQETVELINYVEGKLEDSTETAKKLKMMYADAMYKYLDYEKISDEAVMDVIREFGYEYIVDIFTITPERLRILAAYIPMIHAMKSSRPGLQLVFDVLGVGLSITEWWEDPNNLEVLSYILAVELINLPVNTSIIPGLQRFSRKYVYPLLTNILFATTYKLNKTPVFAGGQYFLKTVEVWIDILWLIWGDSITLESQWSDQSPFQNPPTNFNNWGLTNDALMVWNDLGEYTPEESRWTSPESRTLWNTQNVIDSNILKWLMSGQAPPEPSEHENENWSDVIETFWN